MTCQREYHDAPGDTKEKNPDIIWSAEDRSEERGELWSSNDNDEGGDWRMAFDSACC